MNRAGDVLGKVLARHDIGRLTALGKLAATWPRLMGPSVAGHAVPVDLRDGVLHVAVDSPVWMQQLSFLKKDLLERLSPNGVTAITLRLGPPAGRERDAARREKLLRRDITDADRHFIDRCLDSLADAELRETLRRALTASMSRSRAGSTDESETGG